jgi:hypothetical protein
MHTVFGVDPSEVDVFKFIKGNHDISVCKVSTPALVSVHLKVERELESLSPRIKRSGVSFIAYLVPKL